MTPKKPFVALLLGIDPRSLAALRIAMAAIILVDLLLRTEHFNALYTDQGALPFRIDSLPLVPLHALSGAFWYQATLFVVASVFALLMLVGLFTRVATVASWALLVSLHAQNAMTGYFADEILRQVVFWCMFVPLGRVWSLDAGRARTDTNPAERFKPVLSLGGAGLLFQIAAVYFFSGLLKYGPDWWESGNAITIALNRDWLVRPLGVFLRDELSFLNAPAVYMVLACEIVGPLCLFSPVATGRMRLFFVGLSWFFQYILSVTFFLGIMPWVNAAMMLAFLPAMFWDKLAEAPVAARLRRPASEASFSLGSLETPATANGVSEARLSTLAHRAGQTLAAVCLLYVVAFNVAGLSDRIPFPRSLERAGFWLRINQKWAMFSPISPREDGWYVIPGELRNGRLVNLWWTGPELSWEKPEWISDYHPSRRWSAYLMRLTEPLFDEPEWEHYRRRYAEWLCERWNAEHSGGEALVRLEIIFIDERTPDDLSPPRPVARRFGSLSCSSPAP